MEGGVMVVVNNGTVGVEIDGEYGRIVSLRHTVLDIEVIGDRRLAENFRLLVPLPSAGSHYIHGRDQRLSEIDADDAGCRLTWRGLHSEHGDFDITVTQTIRLTGDDVTFQTELINNSSFGIEEVSAAMLGGMGNVAERADWRIHFADHGGKGQEWPCYDTFPGSYLGPAMPVWVRMYPGGMSMPWVDIYHPAAGKGFYLGNHDPEVRQSILWAELTPCTTHGGPRGDGQYWPDPRHLDGEPAGLAMAWNSMPFVPPGGSWQGPPVVLHFHEGTWWAAAEYFRSWFDTQAPVTERGGWLSDADAWQSTIISYPDGTIGYRFRDLPRLARQARDAGIRVLQIDGWDTGGIDRDYPDYSPDPRLGTADELREALAECSRLGVYVMLFANLQWVSTDTDWYAAELHRYAVRDPHGSVRNGMGWDYNSTLGLLGQTVHRMVMANPSRPEFQRIILGQLANVVRLGAPGTQLDKLLGMNEIDYAPDNPQPRDAAIPAGVLQTLRRFRDEARQAHQDFCIASEAHWDRAVPFIEASYSRFFTTDHLPTFAAAFPEYRQSCCITGDFDYGLVNNCLRFGHVINVEARCLHGAISDVPHLGRYVAEALRVRGSLRDRIWDSRLIDPAQACVHGAPPVLYSMHRGTHSGLYTLVLNHFDLVSLAVRIDPFENSSAATLFRPFTPPRQVTLPAEIDVPADEFVIVAFQRS
jgi:hypothetical protein